MRSPEEIKKGLECCHRRNSCRGKCPYDGPSPDIDKCTTQLAGDALAYIQQLESRLTQVERERDVMNPVFIREMKKYGCTTREHYIPAAYTQECLGCGNLELKHWAWNGLCPKNTEVNPYGR